LRDLHPRQVGTGETLSHIQHLEANDTTISVIIEDDPGTHLLRLDDLCFVEADVERIGILLSGFATEKGGWSRPFRLDQWGLAQVE
jgi:hypothetical protein